LNITVISRGVVKLTTRLIHLGLKPRRAFHAHIRSSILTAKAIIRLIPATVLSGNTASTRSGSQKNMPNSGKAGTTQSIYL